MDIRDFQEGVSFSRFNTRRLPTEEELRAQAEAELKELVLNAIDQVFTRESDTHFDDFALALSAAGITLGADPSGDIAFSNGTVALSGSEVGYTLPALVAMSERANGLDAVTEPQPAAAPEQAQSIEEDTEQAASRLDAPVSSGGIAGPSAHSGASPSAVGTLRNAPADFRCRLHADRRHVSKPARGSAPPSGRNAGDGCSPAAR